jgi:hypothetical protein
MLARKKHWSQRLFCGLCGKSFHSTSAEAVHRHNAPILCVKAKLTKGKTIGKP